MNLRHTRRLIGPLAIAATVLGAQPAVATTPATLTQAMTQWTSKHPSTSMFVVRLDPSGPTPILNYKGDVPRRPASTMKVITASAALVAFGPDFRFTTGLYAPSTPIPGGARLSSTLYLKGGGDPMLATPGYISKYLAGRGTNITGLARALRAGGFTSITGKIVVDESRFDSQRRVASWPARYVIECRPLSAVNVNQGYLRDTRTLYAVRPPLAAGAKLRAAFKRVGITHTGKVVTGRTPAGAALVGSVTSPPLRTITHVMLPESDNYIAETLAKNTGAAVLGRGSTAAGTQAARTLLAAQIGPRNILVDGSGLDRGNRVTPKAMVRVLTAANANPVWGSALIDSLAHGGEGTLERRFLAPSLRNRVHAKTGYIAGTSTITGVVDSRNGVRYAFALYMNDNAITDAKLTQDRIVSLLATGIADAS